MNLSPYRGTGASSGIGALVTGWWNRRFIWEDDTPADEEAGGRGGTWARSGGRDVRRMAGEHWEGGVTAI